jgi:hypothetical protein
MVHCWVLTSGRACSEGISKPKQTKKNSINFFLKIKIKIYITRALPFPLKSILRPKKNYGYSNISPCKKIINLSKIFI